MGGGSVTAKGTNTRRPLQIVDPQDEKLKKPSHSINLSEAKDANLNCTFSRIFPRWGVKKIHHG